MILRKFGTASALSLFLLASSASYAQSQVPPPAHESAGEATIPKTVASEVTWDGTPYTVRLTTVKRERHIEVLNTRGQPLVRQRIPTTALSSVRDLRVHADERPVRGKSPILDVRVSGRSFQNTEVSYQLVFTKHRREIDMIWASRQTEHGMGERLEIENVQGGRSDDLVIYAKSPRVQYCGRDHAPLFPRVWNERTHEFTPISQVPAVEESAQQLTVIKEHPAHHWGVGTELRSVSSDAGHQVLRSYGRAPERLWDNDLSTEWHAQGPDAGVGTFLTAQINPVAGLAGISYVLPQDKALFPRRLLFTTEHASYVVELPSDQRQGYIALPNIDESECVTLTVLEVAPGARSVGFAELHFYTGLDVGAPETVFEERILQPYRAAKTRIAQEKIAALMTINDPRLAQGAVTLLGTLDRDGQVPVVSALMRSEHGQAALYQALRNTELSSAAIAELGRSLRRGSVQDIAPLFQILQTTEEPNTEKSIIRILSRSLSSEDALRLLPHIEKSRSESRGDLVFGLAKAPKQDVNALLHALNGSVVGDPIILRALTRIARREQTRTVELDAQSIKNLEQAIDHDNGTIARIAYELAGLLRVEALRPRLVNAFESDPQSIIRLSAFRGLVHYGTQRSDTADATSLLLQAMDSDDPSMRIEAARHFRGHDMDDAEIDILLQAIRKERWPDASRPLLTALIRQQREDVDLKISSLLLKKERTLLRTALVAWQSRRTPPAFEVLAPLYDLARPTDSHLANWVRAVGHVRSDEAAEALMHHAQSEEHSTRVRAEMLEALGRQQLDQNIEYLLTTLRDNDVPELRRAAARGLAWFTKNTDVKHALERAKEVEEETHVQRSIDAALKAITQAENARRLLLREYSD